MGGKTITPDRQSDDRKSKRAIAPASLANLKGGSRKGIPNKTTTILKDAILDAAAKAGGDKGLVGYLTAQATQNPQSFLPLLGKVLPMTIAGQGAGGEIVHRIELVGVAAPKQLTGPA